MFPAALLNSRTWLLITVNSKSVWFNMRNLLWIQRLRSAYSMKTSVFGAISEFPQRASTISPNNGDTRAIFSHSLALSVPKNPVSEKRSFSRSRQSPFKKSIFFLFPVVHSSVSHKIALRLASAVLWSSWMALNFPYCTWKLKKNFLHRINIQKNILSMFLRGRKKYFATAQSKIFCKNQLSSVLQ